MDIVLDTTVLYRDPWMESVRLRLLREGARNLGARLVIPGPVLDELRRQAKDDAANLISSLTTSARELCKLAGDDAFHPPPPTLVEDVHRQLEHSFRDIQDRLPVHLPPYPSVPHAELAERAIRRVRPFQEQGRGYADALIWYTVLALLSSHSEKVVFISANTKDFGSASKELHGDLLADLDRLRVDASRLEWFHSADAFTSSYVLRTLKPASKLLFDLEEERGPISLRDWGRSSLASLIDADYLIEPAIERGSIDEELDAVQDLAVVDVHRARIRRALELDNGRFAISSSLPCRISFRVVHSPKVIRYQEGRDGPMREYQSGGYDTRHVEDVTVSVAMIISGDPSSVEAADVTGMSGRFGHMEIEFEDGHFSELAGAG